MKKILYILLLCYAQSLSAQIEKKTTTIEPGVLECNYLCIQKCDTLGTALATDTMVLRIGNKVSQFYACSTFHIDSLIASPAGKDLFMKQLFASINSKKPLPAPKILKEYYYKNYPTGKTTTYVTMDKPYFMEEAFQPQAWQLTDSTKNVCGYVCHSATCEFRGRTYEAWYTTEINHREGPWKFNGLPGLITEVYDLKEHYRFTLIHVNRKSIKPVSLYHIGEQAPEKLDRLYYLRKRAAASHKGEERRSAMSGQPIAFDWIEQDYH